MPAPDTIAFAHLTDSMTKGLVNFSTGSFGVILLSALTVGTLPDTAQYVSDVLAAGTEAVGTGYTAGGQMLFTTFWGQAAGVGPFIFDADNPVWSAATISAAYALWFCSSGGSDATNPVIGLWDFGGTVSSSGAAFTLTLNTTGLLTF